MLLDVLRLHDYRGMDKFNVHHQIETCERIAREAHAGQTRRGGEPYIEHPRRIAESLGVPHMACVAWLHDVLEDTDLTAKDLLAMDVNESTVRIVQELTHQVDEPYDAYIERIRAGSSEARTIKICDLVDNLTDDPTPAQVAKYRSALLALAG